MSPPIVLAVATIVLIFCLAILRRGPYEPRSHDRWLLAGTLMTIIVGIGVGGASDRPMPENIYQDLFQPLGLARNQNLLGNALIAAGVIATIATLGFRRDLLSKQGPLAIIYWAVAAPGMWFIVLAAYGLGVIGLALVAAVVVVAIIAGIAAAGGRQAQKDHEIDRAVDRALDRWNDKV